MHDPSARGEAEEVFARHRRALARIAVSGGDDDVCAQRRVERLRELERAARAVGELAECSCIALV
jgi:hypothetical protein